MIGDTIASAIGKIIDRAWPDPTSRAQAAQTLAELQQAGMLGFGSLRTVEKLKGAA